MMIDFWNVLGATLIGLGGAIMSCSLVELIAIFIGHSLPDDPDI